MTFKCVVAMWSNTLRSYFSSKKNQPFNSALSTVMSITSLTVSRFVVDHSYPSSRFTVFFISNMNFNIEHVTAGIVNTIVLPLVVHLFSTGNTFASSIIIIIEKKTRRILLRRSWCNAMIDSTASIILEKNLYRVVRLCWRTFYILYWNRASGSFRLVRWYLPSGRVLATRSVSCFIYFIYQNTRTVISCYARSSPYLKHFCLYEGAIKHGEEYYASSFFFSVILRRFVFCYRYRSSRWGPTYFQSTNSSHRESTNGRYYIILRSKQSGTGLYYCWSCTPRYSHPTSRLFCYPNRGTDGLATVRSTATIRS